MRDPILIEGRRWWHIHEHLPLVIGKVYAVNDDREADPDDFTGICHTHDHPELVIVHGGAAMHSFEGEDYPISSGDVFCILGDQKHYYHHMNNLQLLNIMYDPLNLGLPLASLEKMPGYNAIFKLEPNYRLEHQFSSRLHLSQSDLAHAVNVVESMYSELQERPPGYEAFILGGLIRLLIFLSRHYNQLNDHAARALLRIGVVLTQLEEKPEKPWSLKEMARLAKLNPPAFSHTFKKATGVPPLKYLIQMRIRQSMELLAGTDMSVTEIAFESGFNDSNYFARQFKGIAGMSATEYRKRSKLGGVTRRGE